MDIGFFSIHDDAAEHAVTRAVYAALTPQAASCGDRAHVHAMPLGSLGDTIVRVLDLARYGEYDWCVVSFCSLWTLDPTRLHTLLTSDAVARAAVAVRAGKIRAKAAVFSPKMTFVDDGGILLNVQRCHALGVSERLVAVPFASHFADAGGIHADLLALLESVIPEGALHVYDDGSGIADWRGEYGGFPARPFHYAARFAMASAALPLDARAHALRAALLVRHGLDAAPGLRAYIARSVRHRSISWRPDGAPFFVRPFPMRVLRAIGSTLKHSLGRVNYEIQKTYDDKT